MDHLSSQHYPEPTRKTWTHPWLRACIHSVPYREAELLDEQLLGMKSNSWVHSSHAAYGETCCAHLHARWRDINAPGRACLGPQAGHSGPLAMPPRPEMRLWIDVGLHSTVHR